MSFTRRSLLQGAAALTCGCVARASLGGAQAPRMLRRCGYHQVQLHDSPLLDQFNAQQRLFLGIEDDALLKPFRVRAGQPAPGPDMGGWYDASTDFHIDPNDWGSANWHGFIPGHSFGQ